MVNMTYDFMFHSVVKNSSTSELSISQTVLQVKAKVRPAT